MYDSYLAGLPGPEFVAVTLRDEMLEVFHCIREMRNRDVDLNYTMRLIVEHLQDGYRVGHNLRAHCERMAADTSYETDPSRVMDNEHDLNLKIILYRVLANGLFKQLIQSRLYDETSFLNYQFQGWISPFTIMLTKGLRTEAELVV